MGEVGRIGRVAVMRLGDALARDGRSPGHGGRTVGRRRQHQRDQPRTAGIDRRCRMRDVAAKHLAVPGRTLAASMGRLARASSAHVASYSTPMASRPR